LPDISHSHAAERRIADMARQLVFGLGHGLISILGLSIGVASATGSPRAVIVAGVVGMLTGLATLVALQFLSATTQREIYDHMIEEEKKEFADHPDVEKIEMRDYYVGEGFNSEEAETFVNRLSLNRDKWLKAHVTHVLGFIPTNPVSPGKEATTLGLSHLLGSALTLLPYLLLPDLNSAVSASVVVASITLLVVGGLKTLFTGGRWYTSAARFFVFGMVALLAGYLVGIVLKGSV
jgi:VIT1/CCC1 family predicted Fe2+/Mn2+ transporter